MLVSKLEEILKEQKESLNQIKDFIWRDINFKKNIDKDFVTVITGVRRCGKSYLLLQFLKKIKTGAYVNFEDDRFDEFNANDYDSLLESIYSVYGNVNVFFFDEIQNMPKWELFVRRLNNQNNKIFITGSNAKLLSGELATSLTGRHLDIELLPFSFKEFLIFNDITFKSILTLKEKVKVIKLFDRYLIYGGFPLYVKSNNYEVLNNLYLDIIYKDVVPRYNIDQVFLIKDIIKYLVKNVSHEFSYYKITKTLNIASINTTKKYIDALANSYLIYLIPQYAESHRKQLILSKKVYFVDIGLRNYLATNRFKDKGNLLENMVFLHLRKKFKEIYFYKNKQECDFVLKDLHTNKFKAIQVSYDISNENTKEREINGLLEAMDYFKLNDGLLLSYNTEDKIKVKNKEGKEKTVIIKPVWKWLLE